MFVVTIFVILKVSRSLVKTVLYTSCLVANAATFALVPKEKQL